MIVPPLQPEIAASSQEGAIQLSGISLEWATLILILGVLGYALVNSIEISVVAANRIRIRHLVEQGSGAAKAVQRLQEKQEHFFSAIVLLQNLCVVLASSMGSIIAAESIGGVWGLVLGTIVMALGIALFGEVTPKVLAAHAGERYALLVARPVELMMWILRPLVVAFAAAPSLLSKLLFGSRTGVTETVTEAELRMLIDLGAAAGTMEEAEAELLERVFHFGDRRVNEVMIPRPEIIWIEKGIKVSDFYEVFAEHPHSRFPVYEKSVDNVVGIVGIKDVLRGLASGELDRNSPIDWAMRPTLFVPETKPIGQLFYEMQEAGHQMAIVVDEFGGTAGIVTLEMLLEELVGYMGDELRRHGEEFVAVDERTMDLDAGMTVHDANQELGLDLPDGDYETVAGFVLARLGHIPTEGEQFVHNGWRFAVTQVAGRKIERVIVTRMQEGQPPARRL